MKISQIDSTIDIFESRYYEEDKDATNVGDVVRTQKSETEGTVERIENGVVFIRTQDGRMIKTPIGNTTAITMLDDGMAGGIVGGVAGARLGGARGATAGYQVGSAIQDKMTSEGQMGGINRSRPAFDVSYDKVLDNEESIDQDVYEARLTTMLASYTID